MIKGSGESSFNKPNSVKRCQKVNGDRNRQKSLNGIKYFSRWTLYLALLFLGSVLCSQRARNGGVALSRQRPTILPRGNVGTHGPDFFPEGGKNAPKIVISPKNGSWGGNTFAVLGEG